jgi:hypothetical protein
MSSPLTRAICIFCLFGGAVTACGGSDMAPPRAPQKEMPEPKTVEEAEEQIRIAQDELRGGPKAESKADSTDPAMTAPERPAPPPSPAAEPPKAGSRTAQPENACANPCRALASMRRAVTALCRMTGDTDGRCTSAQEKLKASEALVAKCHCGP